MFPGQQAFQQNFGQQPFGGGPQQMMGGNQANAQNRHQKNMPKKEDGGHRKTVNIHRRITSKDKY